MANSYQLGKRDDSRGNRQPLLLYHNFAGYSSRRSG
jgi:hypothetical protein